MGPKPRTMEGEASNSTLVSESIIREFRTLAGLLRGTVEAVEERDARWSESVLPTFGIASMGW